MRIRFPRLFYALTKYYIGVALVLLIAFALNPEIRNYLPIGGVEELIDQTVEGPFDGIEIGATGTGALGSFVWLIIAVGAALLAALPVSWTYMAIRTREEYNQSLIQTIILLPMIVTGIVIVVHNSLALAFSLAGIAAGVQFRNALKSPGDALFILLSIGTGLAAGIGAVELAFVMTIGFNYGFLVLYMYDYGARDGTQRYMRARGERTSAKTDKKKKKRAVDDATTETEAPDIGAEPSPATDSSSRQS
ncbi:MAG: hypothetical protein ACTS1Z_13490 [Parasphingopyxis sp.]|uniref:hypothetical protein n=1 Tax=Parasphingopyxis sp. TaxID=1920299 RepID=UPI003F9EE164